MNLPKKPLEKNIDAHHETLGKIIQFLEEIHQTGLGVKGFSQAQIDTMEAPSQAGKLLFNETTGKLNVAEINPKTKVIKVKEL